MRTTETVSSDALPVDELTMFIATDREGVARCARCRELFVRQHSVPPMHRGAAASAPCPHCEPYTR
jgi:hypothetical protein